MKSHSSSMASKQNLVPHFPIPPSPPTASAKLPIQAVNETLSAPATVKVAQQSPSLAVGQALELPITLGTTAIPDRATFEQLASRDDVPGALGVREVKFLIAQVDTDQPIVYFLNTQNFQFHYIFAREGLGITLSNQEFNLQTYFTDNRKFIAGTMLAHDRFASGKDTPGLYAIEFWPTDPVKVQFVNIAFQRICAAMPFAADALAYHPAGETHQALYTAEQAEFDRLGIRQVSTEQLFGNISYSPLNLGEAYGRLRLIDPSDPQPPTVRDMGTSKSLSNKFGQVFGTTEPLRSTSSIELTISQRQWGF